MPGIEMMASMFDLVMSTCSQPGGSTGQDPDHHTLPDSEMHWTVHEHHHDSLFPKPLVVNVLSETGSQPLLIPFMPGALPAFDSVCLPLCFIIGGRILQLAVLSASVITLPSGFTTIYMSFSGMATGYTHSIYAYIYTQKRVYVCLFLI